MHLNFLVLSLGEYFNWFVFLDHQFNLYVYEMLHILYLTFLVLNVIINLCYRLFVSF